MRKLKVLLLPDHIHDKWSAFNRCGYIKKYIKDHDFDILGGLDKEVYLNQLSFADKYDFLHINFTGCLEYWYPFYEKYPEKLLITVINERSLLEQFDIKNMDMINQMIYGCCAATSVGYKIADLYHIEYIPNGVDLGDFRNAKQPLVGYCGTERPNKNIEVLKRACNDLKLDLITATHEGKRIPHEDMWSFYRKIDVFVHPSLTEGCSNPVLEALSMNVPIICTAQGIVPREFSKFVTIVDPTYEGLYAALRKYKARCVIEEKFQWSQICKRYQNFYERNWERQQKMLKEKQEQKG